MDPVTHLTTGALGGRLAESRFGGRKLFWFCVAAAWLPDVDNLAGLLGPEPYLLHHRGITHSFFGGLALAFLLAAGFKLVSKKFPFVVGFVVGYLVISLHIFLDLITSYGTQVFSPLTTARYATNSIFIVDPIFTTAIILFLLSTRLWRNHANQIAAAGLGWVLVYPMLCLGVNKGIAAYYADRLDREKIPYVRFELSTEPLSPFLWKLVVEDERHYYLSGVSIFDLDRELKFEAHPKPPPELVERLARKIGMLKTYLWFAKYPTMEFQNTSEANRLLFQDLRFSSTVGFLDRSSHNGNAPFSLVIEL
ncbi:MAG: metal-dependent hydrolase, partial [Candidatus Hydrogenedentota bacterium]